MTERILLRGPISFLILCHYEHGPAFCRALIAVVDGSGHLADPNSVLWGKFKNFNADNKRPANEVRWYNILIQDLTDTIHWYKQFCLNWEVVQLDMQKLSNEEAFMRPVGIVHFRSKYPILFDALYAVFGLLPSNSRLCEQIHGMLRKSLESGIGMDQADAQFSYKVNKEYYLREARRDLVNAGTPTKDKDGNRVRKITKHNRTKEQIEMIGKQMLECISNYKDADFSTVMAVNKINKTGRRVQDKEVAGAKEVLEKTKQARMRRQHITLEEIRAGANEIIPDFELNPHTENDVARRKVTQQLSTQANWNKSVKELKISAAVVFPTLQMFIPPKKKKWDDVSRRKELQDQYIYPYLRRSKILAEKILEYTYGFKDDRTNNPKKDGSWDLIDVLSIYFINYKAESEVDLSRKLIKAARYKAITVLVGTVKKVDTHYTIGLKMGDPIDNIWDDDDIIE